MKNQSSLLRARGFTLIELAIVLAVVGVLAAGLFRLMSTGNSQTKDASTAQQQQALIAAVAGYLSDSGTYGGQNLMMNMPGNTNKAILLPATNASFSDCQSTVAGHGYASTGGPTSPYAALCSYLPPGFSATTTNPYNQTYAIQVLKDSTTNTPPTAPQTYSYAIATFTNDAGSVIPDIDGGRISSLIGGDGGFIYTSPVCTAASSSSTACGNMGAWQSNIQAQYGFTASYSGGIVSRSFISPGTNNSYFWLARTHMAGDTTFTYNTMQVDEFMNPGTNLHINTGSLVVDAAVAPPNVASISLNTLGNIMGNGNPLTPQIQIIQPQTVSDSNSASPPVQISSGCSLVGIPSSVAADPNCQVAALSIPTGDIFVGGQIIATKIYSASDERLKTNIQHLDGELDNVMKMDPVSFSFKQGGGASMGIIAQELEKVYPQLVTQHNGTKYVEYNGLVGPMLAAIQELKHQNDDLRDQLAQQKARQDRIEGEMHVTPPAP